MSVIIPFYHLITDEDVGHVRHIYKYKKIKQFKRDLEILLKIYTPISLENFKSSLRGDARLRRNSMLLTFDDGLREMYDIVCPILLEYGIPAVFFVVKNFTDNNELFWRHKASLLIDRVQKEKDSEKHCDVLLNKSGIQDGAIHERIRSIGYTKRFLMDELADEIQLDFDRYLHSVQPYMTSEQIQKVIKCGFAIGGHSIDHPRFSTIPLEEQVRQVRESVHFVKEKFNLSYGVFAFPHTDAEVGKVFFDTIFSDGQIELTFGSAGMISDSVEFHCQRFSLEKQLWPASKILFHEYARKFYRKIRGRDLIKRKS
jgi:peptidoglycan/xylan/chitin deacetylase (PgdA/CDA1 family)